MLKTFFLEKFMNYKGFFEKLWHSLKTGGQHSKSSQEDDSQLNKETNRLTCIVFSINREYRDGLYKLICNDLETRLEDSKLSDSYPTKQKTKEEVDNFIKKAVESIYNHLLKTLFLEKFGNDIGKLQHSLRTGGQLNKETNNFLVFSSVSIVSAVKF